MTECKIVDGFGGRYLAFEDGRIFCISRNCFLSPKLDRNGYQTIGLRNNKGRKQYSWHRIIANTFIPNPKNKREVNHIDGNKQNNNSENLEWSTRSENNIHALKNGLRIAPNKFNYKTIYYNSSPVYYIKDASIIEFLSRKDCARSFGVHKSAVQNAIKRKTNFRGGILI